MSGTIIISKASRRALLCLALVAALLSQNFRHVKAEAAVPRAAAAIAMLDQTMAAGDDSSAAGDMTATWPKCDCCKHCAQPIAILSATFDFTPVRPAHATQAAEVGIGASPPHPDEPPRA